MAERFFGQFLLERGALPREGLLDALEHQSYVAIPLCALALDWKLLTDSQMAELDSERQSTTKKPLERAIRARMLTFQQLEEAARATPERWLFLAEALLRRGWLTLAQAQQFLLEFRLERLAQAPELDRFFQHIPLKQVLIPFVRTTADLFRRYAKQVLKVVEVTPSTALPAGTAYGFMQKMMGDRQLAYVLVLPEELVHPIADHMLQTEGGTLQVNAFDAVLEFVSLVVGNACAELSSQGLHINCVPPQLLMLDAASRELPEDGVTVTVQAARGNFQILLRFPKTRDEAAEGKP